MYAIKKKIEKSNIYELLQSPHSSLDTHIAEQKEKTAVYCVWGRGYIQDPQASFSEEAINYVLHQ